MGVHLLGGGNNIPVKVSDLGLLQSAAVSIDPAHHSNIEHEAAYSISFTVTPSASAEDEPNPIFYMKNESEDYLVVESVTVYSSTDDETLCLFANPRGTPTGADSVTPINSNLGSNKLAVGTFLYGSKIGGLTPENRLGSAYFPAGQTVEYISRNWIVMPRNTSISLCSRYGLSELTITIPIFYYFV